MPIPPKHILPAVVALVVPALVAAVTIRGLEAFRDFEDRREMRNAGHIINGVVRKVGTVEFIENRLAETRPEVVILGNSLSNTDVLPALLARRLGLPKQKVQRFSVPNSLGPHWYAILENRVYANGYEPKLVIVLADLQSMLATRPRSEAAYLNLTVQLGDHEPVIDEKVARGAYWWDRVRENRGRMRDRSLNTVRNVGVNLFWFRTLSASGRKRTDDALASVFSDENTDMMLHNNVIPIYNTQARELYAYDPAELPSPKESFLPDITQMVADHGGTTVFLRPPMSPLLPDHAGDQVLPGVEERVRQLVEARGGLFMDMHEFEMNAGHYYNLDHMNGGGARRFTEAVAQVLVGADVLQTRRRRAPAEAQLFQAVAFADGEVVQLVPEARFQGEVPSLRARDWKEGRQGRAYFTLPALAALSDERTMELTPFSARCSPVRVLEGGQPLARHGVGCEEVDKHGQGRVCHRDDRVYFSATDRTSPRHNGRAYTLAFDAERACEGAAWLYPGDRAVLRWPDETLTGFGRGARQLRFEAVEMLPRSERAGAVEVALAVGGRPVLQERLPLERLPDGAHGWHLPQPLKPGGAPVELRLTNDSDSFLLVTSAVLTERPPADD